jgi:hypothetical protein
MAALPKGCYVILHLGSEPSQFGSGDDAQLVTAHDQRFDLNDDTWIERLDEELAMNVLEACEPPDYKIKRARQDRHLYAFVKRIPDVEKSLHEGSGVLHGLVCLSRLIHPTSTGDRCVAKVFHYGLAESPIQSIRFTGTSPDVFLSPTQRDWLSTENAEVLRLLMPLALSTRRMPDRVHRAYWYHENAMRMYFLDVRLPLVVTGLESLTNTDENNNRAQFCGRVAQLAIEFNVDLSDGELKQAWKLRSKLLHAEGFLHGLHSTLPRSEHSDLYDKLEVLLRVTVKHCLLDEGFGDIFLSKRAIESRWPL